MFKAGKEIEAMKRLTLYRIASLLRSFIPSIAQLCSYEHCPYYVPSQQLCI
jgi:hypothetical protein